MRITGMPHRPLVKGILTRESAGKSYYPKNPRSLASLSGFYRSFDASSHYVDD